MPGMEAYRGFLRRWLVGVVCVVLAIGATVESVNYWSKDSTGTLAAGFPVFFIWDDAGGSPIATWGQIDAGDWVNLDWVGYFLDILFYSVLFWTLWLSALVLVRRLRQSHARRRRTAGDRR